MPRFRSKFFFREQEEATTGFIKPGARSPLHSTSTTKVSVMTNQAKRSLRICFHMANIVLPIVCVCFVIIFFMAGAISSSMNKY